MAREFPPCHHKTPQPGCFACEKWANDPAYRAMWSGEPAHTVTIIAPPKYGPGTELAKLLGELGFNSANSCGCEAMKNWMNRLGVEGCKREREKIIAHLNSQKETTTFGKKIMAALKAAVSDIPFTIPALVDLAIKNSVSNAG